MVAKCRSSAVIDNRSVIERTMQARTYNEMEIVHEAIVCSKASNSEFQDIPYPRLSQME
jgi:hypothetical protein